jgi:hypothetical protein
MTDALDAGHSQEPSGGSVAPQNIVRSLSRKVESLETQLKDAQHKKAA